MTNYFRPSTKPRATISIVCDVDEAKYRTVSNFQFNYLIWVQLFAMITAGLQAEIMGDAAPTIAKKFGAELKLSWMASSGFMVQVCSLLVLGRLYDFLEPKRILIFCCTCFITGSVISARATSFSILIAGQAVAGLGRSGITVGAVLILAVICPDRKQRAIYLSIVTASYGIMLKIAPVISGLLLENHGTERWRWIFWICVPFQSVLLLLVCAFPPLRRRRASWQQCKDFDFFGALLQAVAMSSFIVPLLVGNTTGKYAWRSPVLIALYVLSPLLLMSFVYWESRKEERHRFIPLHAMCRNPSILALAVVAIASSSIVAATTFFMPQYLQLVRDSSPIVSALQLLPSIFLGSGASIMVGKLLAAKGSGAAQFICIFGSLCQIIGGLAFYFAPFQKNMLGFYAISLTIGFGAGSLFAIGITLVLEIMPDSAFGQITAFMNTATAIGSVLGVALQGVIVQTGMERILANVGGIETLRLLTKMVESRDDSMLSLILGLQSGGNLVTTLSDLFVNFKADYHDTQRQASLLYAALGALSLLASLCLRSMGKDKMGGTISVHEGLDEEEYQQAAATLTLTLPVPVRRSVMSLDQTRVSVIPQSVTTAADEKHFRRQTIVQSDASDEKTPEIREATTTVSSQDRPTCPTVVVTSPPATLTVPPLDSLKDDENIKHELELAISLDVHAAKVNSDTLS